LQEMGERRGRPKMKELVVEASRALARLDADRLEELALCCQALNRDLAQNELAHGGDAADRAALSLECKEAQGDMAVFARVLEATRANLEVMSRLRDIRAGRLEYGEGHSKYNGPQMPEWRGTEIGHGDN